MYNKLLFELSREGRRGHILPKCDVPEKSIEPLGGKVFVSWAGIGRFQLSIIPQVKI